MHVKNLFHEHVAYNISTCSKEFLFASCHLREWNFCFFPTRWWPCRDGCDGIRSPSDASERKAESLQMDSLPLFYWSLRIWGQNTANWRSIHRRWKSITTVNTWGRSRRRQRLAIRWSEILREICCGCTLSQRLGGKIRWLFSWQNNQLLRKNACLNEMLDQRYPTFAFS